MHAHHHYNHKSIACRIVTISDSRTDKEDKSGRLIHELLQENDHQVMDKIIIEDEETSIRNALQDACADENIEAVITNGGTGIAHRDVTIETVESFLDKEIPGFGELFRMLSYQEDIGSGAMLSRAIAGVSDHTAIFSTPGSSGAVKLAMQKLILPELSHVVREIQKDLP